MVFLVEGGPAGLFLPCRQRQHLAEELFPGLRNPPFASANIIGEEILPDRLVISDRLVAAQLLRDFGRSEEHTSELQSLMRISYAVFCLKKKKRIDRLSYRDGNTTDREQDSNHNKR